MTENGACPQGPASHEKRGRLSFVTAWMELENVMLNEVRQKRTKTKRPHTWDMKLQAALRHCDGEVTKGKGGGGRREGGKDQRMKGQVHCNGD